MQRRGDAAEDLVASHLVEAGWAVLGHRFRVGRAEIDILAIDPGPPAANLVVVEVRWRNRRDFGLPEETVTHAKRARLRMAAHALLEKGALPDGTAIPRLPLRYDLVVVEPDRLRHHRHGA
jgi:putative endonuclease